MHGVFISKLKNKNNLLTFCFFFFHEGQKQLRTAILNETPKSSEGNRIVYIDPGTCLLFLLSLYCKFFSFIISHIPNRALSKQQMNKFQNKLWWVKFQVINTRQLISRSFTNPLSCKLTTQKLSENRIQPPRNEQTTKPPQILANCGFHVSKPLN